MHRMDNMAGTNNAPLSQGLKDRAGAGRPLGVQNKIGVLLKEAIAASFDKVGGTEWLVKLAKENPKSYAMLLCKMIPQQTQSVDSQGNDAPLTISIVYKKTDALDMVDPPKIIDAEITPSISNTQESDDDAVL